MWQCRFGHIGERAITIVAIELILQKKIIGHVKIGPTIVVVVPPGGTQADAIAFDPRLGADIGPGTVTIVAVEVVVLTRNDRHVDISL